MEKYKTNKYIAFLVVLQLFSCQEILEVPDISDLETTAVAPLEGAVVEKNTVTFTWNAVSDAENYVLQVASPSFKNAAQVVVDSTMAVTTFTKELLPSTYEWRVKAINSAYETAYTTNSFLLLKNKDFETSTVLLQLPEENYATNVKDVTFSWEEVVDASEYRFRILKNSEAIIDETAVELSVKKSLEEGVYQWQVRGQIAIANTLYTTRAIIVDLTVPNTPVLSSPANNESTTDTTIDFTWTREAISGSNEKDVVYIYSDEALTVLVKEGEAESLAYQTTLSANTYFWIVKSFDAAGNESEVSNTHKLIIN